jgi:hypothetical protein
VEIARSSKLLGKITVLIVICCLVMGSLCIDTAVALDGSGTQEEPWLIQSLENFNDFAADANYWDDYTRLETDVNLTGRIYTTAVIAPDVNNFNAPFDGNAFTGVFDGNDHKIINLTIDDGEIHNNFLGLFGCIDGGEVMNLGLDGGFVSGEYCVGGLVGENDGNILNCYSKSSVRGNWFNVGGLVGKNGIYGSISNCYSTGDANGAFGFVGGLVGFNYGSVSNCYSAGDVSGEAGIGGLVGYNTEGNISNCYSTGDVSGEGDVGGLVGYNSEGNISNCYSTSDVSGGGRHIGGLVGYDMNSSVSYCYSTGNVSGENEIGGLVGSTGLDSNISNSFSTSFVNCSVRTTGGLVGMSFNSIISNCYSSGDVNGVYTVGGLVGWDGGGGVSNCYSTSDVSGRNNEVGGLIGMSLDNVSNCFWDTDAQTHGVTESIGDPGGTVINVLGLPTTEMHQQSTFTDWDFINVWNIGENQTYPYLRIYLPSDINKDGIVNFLDLSITANQWMQEQ